MEAKGFGIIYEVRKIKDVEMEQDIDFEHLESEIWNTW